MYPISHLQQIKDEEFQQEQAELQSEINNLARYHNYSNASDFLDKVKNISIDRRNIDMISASIKEIKDLIKNITQPAKEKIKELTYLKNLIEIYYDPNESKVLNSSLTAIELEIKNETSKISIDPQKIEEFLSKIDSISHENLKKILGKLKLSLAKPCDLRYEDYLVSELERITQYEKEISETSSKVSSCYESVRLVRKAVEEFEISQKIFLDLIEEFNRLNKKHDRLIQNLINSDVINSSKAKIEHQIEILKKEIDEFNPLIMKSICNLSFNLQSIDQEINELKQLNLKELKKQQKELIMRVQISEKELRNHTIKLSESKTKLAKAKYDKIEKIRNKIDSLNLEKIVVENSNENINTDNIDELIKIIEDSKAILSEYRGISLLRCFATLWGGGKVSSIPLVNTLEAELTTLQQNVVTLSPKH